MFGQAAPNHYVVTPSDTVDLAHPVDYLLIENTSSVVCQVKISDVAGITAVHYIPAGQYFWGRASRVWATGLTAATQVIAFF